METPVTYTKNLAPLPYNGATDDGTPVIHLPERTRNTLVRNGIWTVDELCTLNQRELLGLPGMGEGGVLDIVHALDGIGRELQPTPYGRHRACPTCGRNS
jgi:DNA-directed RNA polymerase alpha subunit